MDTVPKCTWISGSDERAFLDDIPLRVTQSSISHITPYAAQGEAVGAHHALVDSALLALLQQNNRQLYVWTVDDNSDIIRMLNIGVDALVTDKPGIVVEAVQGRLERCGHRLRSQSRARADEGL